MDFIPQIPCGIPQDVFKLLTDIHTDKFGVPKWSVRVTEERIYLDLAWDRKGQGKPAHKSCVEPRDHIKKRTNLELPVEGSKDTTSDKPLKKKSPSRVKRDRLRYLRWKAKKWGESSARPCRSPQANTASMDNQTSAGKPLDQLLSTATDKPIICSSTSISAISSPCVSQDPEHLLDSDVAPESSNILQESGDEPSESDSEVTTESDDSRLELDRVEDRCFNIYCMKTESSVPQGLRKCTQCMTAMYCSKECQTQHWQIHMTACKLLAGGSILDMLCD